MPIRCDTRKREIGYEMVKMYSALSAFLMSCIIPEAGHTYAVQPGSLFQNTKILTVPDTPTCLPPYLAREYGVPATQAKACVSR